MVLKHFFRGNIPTMGLAASLVQVLRSVRARCREAALVGGVRKGFKLGAMFVHGGLASDIVERGEEATG